MFDGLKNLSQNTKDKVKWLIVGVVLGVAAVMGFPIVRTVVSLVFVGGLVFLGVYVVMRIDLDKWWNAVSQSAGDDVIAYWNMVKGDTGMEADTAEAEDNVGTEAEA